MCNENDCEEGLYNLNGICFNCSDGLPYCKKCHSEIIEYNQKKYKCDECLNDEYKINQYGVCTHCSMNNCKKCHYNPVEPYNQECDECYERYYINSNKECSYCHYTSIDYGYCYVCSDVENDYAYCYCYTYFTNSSLSTCVECPENCPECQYNTLTNRAECTYCETGYTLNSEKTCTYCGDGCETCSLADDSTPICSLCFSRNYQPKNNECIVCDYNCEKCIYDTNGEIKCIECKDFSTLLSNGTCQDCPNNCYSCSTSENDKVTCLECTYEYGLTPTKECEYCPNIDQPGIEGCQKCNYNLDNGRYECDYCKEKYNEGLGLWYYGYAFVTNTFECFDNEDSNQPAFYHCLESYFNSTINKYECITCNDYYNPNHEYYIKVVNDKICRTLEEMELNRCYEAENIAIEGASPIYSCNKCYENTTKIKSENNKINCYERKNKLAYCLEGEKDSSNNIHCTLCVPNSSKNSSGICECDSDSFGKHDQWCYKCDDNVYGNPGCDTNNGCTYYHDNDELDCTQCKDGYFKYTQGQCFPCSYGIKNCEQCHFDGRVICDQCLNEYIYNSQENKCEIKNCEDYPEFSEGCLICEGNNFNNYISNKKCQSCKPGYFKTKDGKCVYCRSEKYGGPACYKCKYETNEIGEETDNIICDYCPEKDHAISSDGKCFNCAKYFSNCEVCEFKKNNDNTEKLTCAICKPGFYVNSEGECINYLNYIEKISNCLRYSYKLNNITFCTYLYYYYDEYEYYYYGSTYYCYIYNNNYYYNLYNNYYYYYSFYEYKNSNSNITNFNIPIINSPIKGQCIECSNGYYLNSEGNCLPISIEECSLTLIMDNFPERYKICENLCSSYKYIDVNLTYKIESNNNYYSGFYDIRGKFRNLYYDYYEGYFDKDKDIREYFEEMDDNLISFLEKRNLCIPRNNNFENCENAEYDENSNNYICTKCYSDYYLDTNSNTCKREREVEYNNNYNCYVENIGTKENPIYSCTKCYNDKNYLLISKENNVKYCIYKEDDEIQYCTEANIDTTYVNTIYNCTNCSFNFLPYYSKFFGRKICQNIYDKIIKKKDISLDDYEDIIDKVNAIEGKCTNTDLFTPDGETCYRCNNEKVGMPGCKGACSFSLERNDVLKCEEGCKSEYIEVSKGVCQPCEIVNHGCFNCSYESEYPADYLGIKRKRRFVCNACEEGFILYDGKCSTCEELGLDDCEKCEVDPKNNNEYICTKCNEFSVLIDGYCEYCDDDDEFQSNNQCYECDEFNYGGIKGCDMCERNNNNELICQKCYSDYILLTNNNTCLNRLENKELEKFDYCEKLTLDNNQLYCSKCKREYSLLKDNNNKGKCIKTPSLYNEDYRNFDYYYRNYYMDYYNGFYDFKTKNWIYYYDEDYYYYQNYNYYPCQESINLGTSEKPIYSCTKCYQYFEFKKSYQDESLYTRIINERNNVAICIYQNEDILENCTEAINKTRDGVVKYDCLKCISENKLVYDSEFDIHHCEYANIIKKCMVKYCKTCKNGNYFFCNECLLSNYEVNSLTGECIEKSEEVPAITWKDIFRLEMNSKKTINGQTYNGPSLMLRGITSSQINSRHAFLIYLTFLMKTLRGRNLEGQEIKLPAICQANNTVEKSSDDVKMVDYVCIANKTEGEDLSNYQLKEIEEGENSGLLKKSNLNKIASKISEEDLLREVPNFTLEDLLKYITFEINSIQNQTAVNFTFDFKIEGKINKVLAKKSINADLELNEIEDKMACNFEIEDDKKANLNCKLNIEKYKDQHLFTFKTTEINTDENDFYLSRLDEISLINEQEEKKEEEEEKEERKKKDYTIIIIVCTICGGVLIGGIIASIICFRKRCKNRNQSNRKKNEEETGGNNKIIRYENNINSKEIINQ